MTSSRADPRTVAAYAAQLVAKEANSRVLALAGDPDYDGPNEIPVGDVTVQVRGCVSSLAIREFLVDLPADAYGIVITDRPEEDLGEGLKVRLRKQHVQPLDPWTPVAGLFQGRHLDAGIRHSYGWLPPLLYQLLPPQGYPASPTELVTKDHILGAIVQQVLGIEPDELGLQSVMRQLGDLAVRARWAALPAEPQEALGEWIGRRAGSPSQAALRLAATSSTAHLRVGSIGLLFDVLYGSTQDAAGVAEARHTWEHGYQLPRVEAADARAIGSSARAALRLLRDTDPIGRDPVWHDTSGAFDLAGFGSGMELSLAHPRGYWARLRSIATAIGESLGGSQSDAVSRALAALQDHDLALADFVAETQRAEMAVRLVRWLATSDTDPVNDLGSALARQVNVSGWVDRALADVWSGSTDTQVADAYRRLCERVAERRRTEDETFAHLLAAEASNSVLSQGLLPVEQVLADVVAPVSQLQPVLFIVIDGMSAGVAVAVAEGIRALSWREQVPTSTMARQPVLAALPTMTRYSRTSLLCGALREGTKADEKRSFTELTRGRVFHKDDLRAPAGAAINPDLEAAIASNDRVVGVVINTVDDHLAKHDPDGTRWSVDEIQHLSALLELARRYGRTVVLTSDHGHVVERGGRSEPRDQADARWRPASTGDVGPDEVLLQGPRVMTSGGAIIAPWAEDLRYGQKAAGYHGGASAAEVTIPLLLFTGAGVDLTSAGWSAAPDPTPSWWTGLGQPAAAPLPATPKAAKRVEPVQDDALFQMEAPEATPATPQRDPLRDQVAAILQSETFQRQRTANPRVSMTDDAVGNVLYVLLQGRGRGSSSQVAQVLGLPATRLPGAMSHLRRLLNVEAYPVISMDPDNTTVLLDQALLSQQFG